MEQATNGWTRRFGDAHILLAADTNASELATQTKMASGELTALSESIRALTVVLTWKHQPWNAAAQSATSDLLEVARSKGYVFDVLAKPVHPSEILGLISRILANQHAAVVPPRRRSPLRQLATLPKKLGSDDYDSSSMRRDSVGPTPPVSWNVWR